MKLDANLRQLEGYGFGEMTGAQAGSRATLDAGLTRLAERLGAGAIQRLPGLGALKRGDLAAAGLYEITPEIAALTTTFPDNYPKDPGDRLIGATARAYGLTLITQDERILSSPLIRTVW